MSILLEKDSTVTSKGQTTVPKAVRQALGVGYGGRIVYRVTDEGVSLHRADEDVDPVIDAFLSFLADDMRSRQQFADIPAELRDRIDALTKGMKVDLDEAIEGEVAL